MSDSRQYPSYVECVATTLSESTAPMSIPGIVEAVEALRPVSKGARSAVYRAISKLYQAVPTEAGRYGWLSHLMQGVTLRHPLSDDEAERGFLMLDELEHAVFCPEFFQSQKEMRDSLKFTLYGGQTFMGQTYVERRTWSVYLGEPFTEWIETQGGQGQDDIIITVEDAVEGHYMLRLQPREAKDTTAVHDRNIQIAMAAEDIVAEDRRSRPYMPAWELAARLIGSGLYYDPTPPDDMHYLLEQFSLLHFVDDIGYSVNPPPEGRSNNRAASYISRGEEEYGSTDSAYADHSGQGRDHDRPDLGPDFRPPAAQDDLADQFGDGCGAYSLYLEEFHEAGGVGAPLAHHEFHLFEAELEYLVALEVEFGGLLPEQEDRKHELAARLFLDPDAWPNDDFDISDYPDYGDPPFWGN